MTSPKLALFFTCLGSLLHYATPFVVSQDRYAASCSLLQNKLFCYGGSYLDMNGINTISTSQDLFVFQDLSGPVDVTNAMSNWQNVPNPSGFVFETSYVLGSAPLSNNTMMMLSEYGYIKNKMSGVVNKTIIFNADTYGWEATTDGNTNAYTGVSIASNGQNTAWLWGNIQQNNLGAPTEVVKFSNAGTPTWSAINARIPPQNNFVMQFSTSAMVGNLIYYSGGYQHFFDGEGSLSNPLNTMPVFDTNTQTWSVLTMTKGAIPPARIYHSFTYLPMSHQIVMYGGYLDSGVVKPVYNDCFLFDIASSTWIDITSQVNPTGFTYGAGARYGHSAVLLQNRYLIIVFGADKNQYALNDFYALDTQTWKWVQSIPGSSPTTTSATTTHKSTSKPTHKTTHSPSPSPSSPPSAGHPILSTPAIAGIAVGGAVLAAFVGFFAYRMHHKRQNRLKFATSDRNITQDRSIY